MFLTLLFACSTDIDVAEAKKPAKVEEAAPAQEAHFGAEFTTTDVVKADVFLADPSPWDGKVVRVEGRVADVCQKKGCWMVLTDEEKSVRVLMVDHSFSVAKDGTGRTAQVEGKVEATEVSEDFVKHLEEESENPDAMPEKSGAAKLYQIQATAVRFLPDHY